MPGIIEVNNTVLLRERKRHNARRVASTRCAGGGGGRGGGRGRGDLPWFGGTYLGSTIGVGVSTLDWGGGTYQFG